MAKSGATKRKTGDDKASAETPVVDTSHDAHVRRLLDDHQDPEEIAEILFANQRYSLDIMSFVAREYGNAFMTQVLDAYGKLMAAKPDDGDHAGTAKDQDGVSTTCCDPVANKVHRSAPDPTDKLPYDGRGGWNALEINQRLGQYDQLHATDSDGARCAFATVVAAHVFEGPARLVSWLKSYTAQKAPASMTDRQAAAANVMMGVNEAILAGTATYGDLSWLQEGLHAFQIKDDQRGPRSASWMVATTVEDVATVDVECTSATALIGAVKDLEVGERAYLEWRAQRKATASDKDVDGDGDADGESFDHMMMIVNEGGTKYIYDSAMQADGTHLDVLTAKSLRRYFGAKFAESKIKVAVTSKPKARS